MDLLIDDDCTEGGDVDSCSVNKSKTVVLPLVLGFDYQFTNVIGGEVSYEHGLTESIKNIKINSFILAGYYKF